MVHNYRSANGLTAFHWKVKMYRWIVWLALFGLFAAGCPSSKVSVRTDTGVQDGTVADWGAGDGKVADWGVADGIVDWDVVDGIAPEVVCDVFVAVDFPCSKELVCFSAVEYKQFETVPCWEEYPRSAALVRAVN